MTRTHHYYLREIDNPTRVQLVEWADGGVRKVLVSEDTKNQSNDEYRETIGRFHSLLKKARTAPLFALYLELTNNKDETP